MRARVRCIYVPPSATWLTVSFCVSIPPATSDGTRQGLDSMRGGVCATQGMKVVLKVGQSPYGLPPKKDPPAVRTTSRNPGGAGNSTQSRGPNNFGNEGDGENGPLQPSNIALIAGAAGGSAFLLLVTAVICVVCYRRRHAKHSDTHHPPLSLSSLTSPKRGGGGGLSSSNNNGSEPSDIIIPLRTSDSAYCPHYEKVSGDYGHPVYIVQEMPPQSPANIYYKLLPTTTSTSTAPSPLLSPPHSAVEACTTLHAGRQAKNSGDGRFPVYQACTDMIEGRKEGRQMRMSRNRSRPGKK
ncbi:hypothetical protein FQN60_006205, partial [Etheostoma spectabile]